MNALLRPGLPAWHRAMTVADVDAVVAVEGTAYSWPWSRGNFIDSLAAGYRAELRLDDAGRLLGYCIALPGFEETHLLNLTVTPALQRCGHGLALLQRLQHWAQQRGDQALWLEVRQGNVAARALYRQAGFVEVGCRRDYYPADRQKREDALVLRLALPPRPGSLAGAAHDALV